MLVAGFDGWKAGWVGIVLDTGHFVRAISTASLAEALDDLNDASVISVDIPMTMPQGAEPRPAERHAKRMLGRRSSTIFMTPPEPVLRAETYAAARRVSTDRFGRGVSAQAYALRSRILEVAPLARHDKRLHEIHPELGFMAMNDGVAVEANKKTWAGQMVRRRLLERHGIELPDDLGPVGVVPPDDVIDAAAAAWSAARIASGKAAVCSAAENLEPNESLGRLSHIWY